MQHHLDIKESEPTISKSMQCPSCGVQNQSYSSFCINCGTAIFADENKPHLGHYRLESKLGEGGMGVVYRATDEKLHREVAVKVLHPHLLKHENLKERFRREARMHAKIIHPHIVTLLSLYEDGDHMALVMEMIHGKNLKDYLREHHRPDLTEVVRISEAILSGLDAAHRQGMVHRDLKPANVMLATNGGIKLMDFGLAKPNKHGDDDLTQSGATVGSFRYMAPEQILNQPIDTRSDLYAFGILLYQMVTGKLPFDSTSNGGEFEIMEKQVRHDPVPPSVINPNLPKDLSDLIMKLLSKDKESRPANCEVVQFKLLEILQQAERLRSHASQITNRPSIQPQQSSSEIAKGLVLGWSRRFLRALINVSGVLRPWVWEKPATWLRTIAGNKASSSLPGQESTKIQNSFSTKWQGPAIWTSVIAVLIILGWVLVSVIHVAERPKEHIVTKTAKEAAKTATRPETKKPVSTASVQPPISSSTPAKQIKPIPTVVPAKKESIKVVPQKHHTASKKVKKFETKHKRVSRPKRKVVKHTVILLPVTYKVPYKVVNSQSDKIRSNAPNEFRGGSRLYFKSLKDNRFGDFLTFRKGWVRLFFDQPVNLSEIKIHKITTGTRSFRGGSIELAVQDSRGHWTILLRRRNRDIVTPLVIRNQAALAMVKGVRLRFRSSAPLEVGPIDLLP